MVKDKDGKVDKAVILALKAKYPIQRLAAAEALARSGGAAQRAGVQAMLKDKDVTVRRRVALLLLEMKDKAAVPTLISLISEVNTDDLGTVEDALVSLAGDKAPPSPDDDNEKTRVVYKKAWEKWYDDSGKKLDLAKIDLSGIGRGYTVICTLDSNYSTGKVFELNSSGKERWKISNLRYPVCASVSRSDRVLICEYYGNKVTERDFKGNIKGFDKTFNTQVVAAHRLAGGKTFVATRNGLYVYDRTGKEEKAITRPSYDVYCAWRYKDGSFGILSNGSTFVKLDKSGAQKASFYIGTYLSSIGVKCHFTKKGGVIVPDYSRSEVREYDASGKQIWKASVKWPNAVSRLPNGKVIVGSRNSRTITELDKNGKVLTTKTLADQVLYVEKR